MVPYQMAVGHYLSRAICLAAKLRIADLLKDGPRHFDDLALATGTNAASINRVMRLLTSVGVFDEKENGNFALTALGHALREDVPGSARALVMMFAVIGITTFSPIVPETTMKGI
jgi:predicted transcriptional regulator